MVPYCVVTPGRAAPRGLARVADAEPAAPLPAATRRGADGPHFPRVGWGKTWKPGRRSPRRR